MRIKKFMAKKKKNIFKRKLLMALVVLSAFFLIVPHSFANSLKFVQISDSHIANRKINTGYKFLAQSDELLKNSVKKINAVENVDFIFHTGDGVDVPDSELIKRFVVTMNTLNKPWYFVFGNHDGAYFAQMSKAKYLSYLKQNNQNFKFSNPYYSFSPKDGYKVIALDCSINDKLTANGKIDKVQLEWLKKELNETSKDDAVLIFSHCPIKEPFPSFHHRLENEVEVRNLLKSFNRPIAVFAGHYHSTKIEQEDKVLHVASPALVSFPNAFRIVNVHNNKENVIFDFDYQKTDVESVVKEAAGITLGKKKYLGEEKDRKSTVVISK